MNSDYDALAALNHDIATKETKGEVDFFKKLLAPVFAMRRASGKVVDRDQFIASVSPSGQRTTEIESIDSFGAHRATVACIVTMATNEGPKRFHNLRLFVREKPESPWQLLAWANEPVA